MTSRVQSMMPLLCGRDRDFALGRHRELSTLGLTALLWSDFASYDDLALQTVARTANYVRLVTLWRSWGCLIVDSPTAPI